MHDDTFSRPVTLFSPQRDGSIKHTDVATVAEGFRALNRGFEGFCLESPEWHLAFHRLTQAMLEPTPERVEAARAALDLLAGLTREAAIRARVARKPQPGRCTAH